MTVLREVEFENNPLKVCYSGQMLKGKATIFFDIAKHVRGISIKFVGRGFCEWSETHTNRTVTQTGSEKYLDIEKDFVRCSNADVIIPAGNHEYPFEIQLPSSLPTSYEGTYGYIRYKVMLIVDSSAHRLDPFEETFTVIKSFNLSNGNVYRMPIEELKFVRFSRCCMMWWWKSGELKIYGRLPVRGYCPGQTMNLKIDVINQSGQDIHLFMVEFIQEVTYNSTEGSKKFETIVLDEQSINGCSAERIGIQTFGVNVTVPSIPPTGYTRTDFVCIFNYRLRVTAVTDCLHHNPMFEIPVIIGTYPVSDEIYSASAPIFTEVETNIIPNSSEAPPYPDADPPTYEEAVNRTPIGNKKYSPKYPVYRRTTSYSSNSFE